MFKGNLVNSVRIVPFSAFEFFFYDLFKRKLGHPEMTFYDKLTCGALAGIAASTFTYPLDLVKVHISINKGNLGMLQVAQQVYKADGFLGFYKGWAISVTGIMPFVGLKMSSFDWMYTHYSGDHSPVFNACAGALSGLVAVSVAYPLDLIRRKLQLNHMTPEHNYTSLFDACRQTYDKGGI